MGILPGEYRSPAREMAVEHFNHVMAVNVGGPFVVTQAAMPHLERVRGNVLFIASVYGDSHPPHPVVCPPPLSHHIFLKKISLCTIGNIPVSECVDYTASKAAVKMVAKNFALEEADKGVRVHCARFSGMVDLTRCLVDD